MVYIVQNQNPATENKNNNQSNADNTYFKIVKKILNEGEWKENRTGIRTLVITGAMFDWLLFLFSVVGF